MILDRSAPHIGASARAAREDARIVAELTGPGAIGLVSAVLAARGREMTGARLDHVDHEPGRALTVTYQAQIAGDAGRTELVGITARLGGPTAEDAGAQIFERHGHRVATWIYPDDPDLPGLARITRADSALGILARRGLIAGDLDPARLTITVISYRPRRRAVIRIDVAGGSSFYVKAQGPEQLDRTVSRQEILARAGLPVPRIMGVTADHLLITEALPGLPMARLLFEPEPQVRGEQIVALLDALPGELSTLPRRAAWADATAHYAGIVATQLPAETERLEAMTSTIAGGITGSGYGTEPTHGDFHEGQVHLAAGRIVGLLDVDACGPGQRVDDLACLIAHLSTVQRMDPVQTARVTVLRNDLLEVFDHRVDPVQLRLRAAGVAISLATGPYRGQEVDWQGQTRYILDAAEALIHAAGGR